jgi:hypothetical protein
VELDKIGNMYIGFDLDMMEAMSFTQLKNVLSIDINQYQMKCFMAAEILLAKHKTAKDNLHISGPKFEIYLKIFDLFFEAIHDNTYFQTSAVFDKINEVIQALSGYKINQNIKLKIFHFHDLSGNYGAAENVLFELIGDKPLQLRDIGLEFYKRLLNLDDATLVAGNLPRDEVIEGLVTFKSSIGN